jgi:hypothetical protein
MCKSCVHGVQTMVKTTQPVHKLYAVLHSLQKLPVRKRKLYAKTPQLHTPTFSTSNIQYFNLLFAQLYPSSTVPIIRAIK